MKHIVWLLKWFLKAAIFFTLFAFALNNQQDATVHFFFGTYWRAPTVIMVLVVFVLGLGLGIATMLPKVWRSRQLGRSGPTAEDLKAASPANALPQTPPGTPHGN